MRKYVYLFELDSVRITDEDIIRKLRVMSTGFVIYTYNQVDYEQKVINLIHVFGKEHAMDMIEKKFIRFVPCE